VLLATDSGSIHRECCPARLCPAKVKEVSSLGVNVVYSVWLEMTQHDADGDGPYRDGQVLGERTGATVGRPEGDGVVSATHYTG
jgi:hypothetical protein